MIWEGLKVLQNLHCRFDCYYIGPIYSEDFVKICGLLRTYELVLQKFIMQPNWSKKTWFIWVFMVLWIYNFELGLLCLYSNFRFSLNPRDIKIKFDTPFPQIVNVFPIIYYFIKNKTTICVKERKYKYVHIKV